MRETFTQHVAGSRSTKHALMRPSISLDQDNIDTQRHIRVGTGRLNGLSVLDSKIGLHDS